MASNTERINGSFSEPFILFARATGLEPVTSSVTGKRSNQLSYARRNLRESTSIILRFPQKVKSWRHCFVR